MNDADLEKRLRELPEMELPLAWRGPILAAALRAANQEGAEKRDRAVWPPLLVMLRNLFARNPVTATALAMMWILIFALKAATPVDPAEKEMLAHFDPNRPVYGVSLREQIELAQLLENPAEPASAPQIP
jgi:hypothetical protein